MLLSASSGVDATGVRWGPFAGELEGDRGSRTLKRVLRTALRPKFVALLALALVLIAAFVQLGRWQLDVAEGKATQEVLEQARAQGIVDLATVLRPHQPFPGALSARQVSARGEYVPGDQVLVTDRRLEGREGYWVVTALRTEAGGVLPVLRGFTTSATDVPPPPTGVVTVEGGLAPGESPAQTRTPAAPGQMGSIDLAVLVNQWPGDLYNAFLFLSAEHPVVPAAEPSANGTGGLQLVPTPTRSGGLNWRNASYAAQWWVFAVFALWMWWRMVRDEHRRSNPVDDPGETTEATKANEANEANEA